MEQIAFRTEGLSKVCDIGEVKVHALTGVHLELHAGDAADDSLQMERPDL